MLQKDIDVFDPPIIYVRGYAGSKGTVESTVDRPYYGFNLGSTQVRAKWAGLDSDLPATGKRYPRNDNIRFPLPSKNLDQGDLVLRVRDERSNSTRHLL
ncbi:hypothetical protein [Desulfotignum phosphitoxidans]|uniref:Uncharacterized protein n=1 Tax=Desulfotignum phosphitoxidans DSM 13687 TaxID=1286635 RepID=S0G2B5_9BACT|nr:hypothetical protein [Desulfotignum phosphitoxidans]EMS77861.1 hypothetical protein Dpo_11c00030 [Desulfotignum phosphitoxidans DSM 13687]